MPFYICSYFDASIAQSVAGRILNPLGNDTQQFSAVRLGSACFQQVADYWDVAQHVDFGQRIAVVFFINTVDNQCSAVFNHSLCIQVFGRNTQDRLITGGTLRRRVLADFDFHNDLAVVRDVLFNGQHQDGFIEFRVRAAAAVRD